MLRLLAPKLGNGEVQVAVTGSAGLGVAKAADLEFVQEVLPPPAGWNASSPDADVVVELGGEDAKIIFFSGGLEERMRNGFLRRRDRRVHRPDGHPAERHRRTS